MFNLKEMREYEDYSMNDIGKKLGVSKNAYASWEWGIAVIPLKRLVELANLYQVNIDYLLGLTKNKSKNTTIKTLNNRLICQNLKQIRMEKNLTQQQLAEKLHISHDSISCYESGKVLISTSCLYSLCKKYNISADYILGFSKIKHLN